MQFLILLFFGLVHGERRVNAGVQMTADMKARRSFEDVQQTEPSAARLQWVKEKLTIEREVIQPFLPLAHGVQEAPAEGRAKVAFIFLTMKDLQWPQLWRDFFQDAPRTDYSIYVHRAALKDAEQRTSAALPLAEFGAIEIPWVRTAWCALFGVEVASFYAALQDPNNVQFVLVSDSTVPLKKFSYVYEELAVASPATSKVCLATQASNPFVSLELAKQEAKKSCVFRDFLRGLNPRTLKHHQWAVFARKHAASIVKYADRALDIYEEVWTKASPDVNMADGCSDEAVPVIALLHSMDAENRSSGNTWLDLTRLGVEQNCLTFVRWRNCFTGTQLDLASHFTEDMGALWRNLGEVGGLITSPSEFDFMKSGLKRELNGFPHFFDSVTHTYLQTMVEQGFMFARKFTSGINVSMAPEVKEGGLNLLSWFSSDVNATKAVPPPQPLAELLPEMWDRVNVRKAQFSQWSHLEYDGRPSPLNKP